MSFYNDRERCRISGNTHPMPLKQDRDRSAVVLDLCCSSDHGNNHPVDRQYSIYYTASNSSGCSQRMKQGHSNCKEMKEQYCRTADFFVLGYYNPGIQTNDIS